MKIKLFVLLFLTSLLCGCANFPQADVNQKISKVATSKPEACFNDHCFKIEKAVSSVELKKGLMGREKIAADEGMLFVFRKDDYYSFWMKNVTFSLDLIYLDAAKTVIEIFREVPPCVANPCQTYQPKTKARCVLEILSGRSTEIGLKEGEKMEIKE